MEADAFKYRHEDLAINSDDEKAAQQGGVANPVSKIKFSL
jgi:hypothetical protein